MDTVVDVELFAGNVIKELAFCCGTFHAGFLFKPPKLLSQCTEAEKNTNMWLTRNLHEIAWNAGTLDYSMLSSVIEGIIQARGPDVVFLAKGHEKCLLLSKLFERDFINLETRGCLRIKDLPPGRGVCESYRHRHTNSLHCAQRKAIIYLDWLSDFDELLNIL